MIRLMLLLPLLAGAFLFRMPAQAQTNYCVTNKDAPECYCQGERAQELKCLRFRGANPGFSSKGAGTSATFSGEKAPTMPAAPPVGPQTSVPPENRSDYILFIHFGAPDDLKDPPDASSLVKKLKAEGYVVRGADSQRDDVGAAGIDYFRPEDEGAAKAIAASVNAWLKENKQAALATLKPRRQNVRNPPGYIGVWIFGRPPKA